MNVTKLCLLLSLAALTAIADTSETVTEAKKEKTVCAIRDLPQQVVLYTIYRGNLDDVRPAVEELFNLAGQKGIYPIYPDVAITFVYLNNFQHVSREHWLTEIRVPVDKTALEAAGKLGKMTDVKTISPMKVAVATKPEGMANPEPIYRTLYTWMLKQGHTPFFGPQETFLTNVETADYAQMKTEIMIPIWDVPSDKD